MIHKTAGFTLIELMIVLAIIGILMTIAVPSYRAYTRRAHYTEIVQASGPYKIGIEECHQVTGSLDECKPGQNGVPTSVALGEGAGIIGSIQVGERGIISIVPKEKFGITEKDTYVLTPTQDGNQLSWNASGGAINSGLAR